MSNFSTTRVKVVLVGHHKHHNTRHEVEFDLDADLCFSAAWAVAHLRDDSVIPSPAEAGISMSLWMAARRLRYAENDLARACGHEELPSP